MLSALAAANTHRRRSRSMARIGARGAASGTGAAGARRATQCHSGIHASPSTPVTTNACAPSAAQRDPGGQHRRDHRAQADAGLIDRVAQRALAGPQVLVDRLARGRNAGGFGHAEHRAAAHQSAQPAGEAGGDAGAGPQPHREADGAVQPDAIDQQSGERRAGRVGEAEGAADQAVLRVGEIGTPASAAGASAESVARSR